MPLYLFNTKKGAIADAAKARIAADFTHAYCAVTGAPTLFVNAFFFEELPMVPLGRHTVAIRAGTRQGWSDGQKARIADSIKASIERHAGIAAADVAISFHEAPASWAMEGGDIVPEPGDDAAWLAARSARRAAPQD